MFKLKNKYRVSTTISLKHQEILKKYVEKYGTQQRVLEIALDGLENSGNTELSHEEKVWMRIYREILDVLCVLQGDMVKLLFETADIDRFTAYIKDVNPARFAVEWYHNKPLEECSLLEFVDGIIMNIKMQSSSDSINLIENDNCYIINITHSLGINSAQAVVIMNENVFKSYGVEFESKFSERSIFFKIFKK